MNEREYFKKFTERTKKVLSLAQEEAKLLQHDYVGTEHILLAIVREGEGVAAHILERLGADLMLMRTTIAELMKPGKSIFEGDRSFTPEARRAIDAAVNEAQRLKHRYLGTEHLLLGLAHISESKASQVLQSMNIGLEDLRIHTMQVLSSAENHTKSTITSTTTVSTSSTTASAPDDQGTRFDKFTKRARKVLGLAQEEAQRFQHTYVGTEHLLLGLVREGEGIGAHVLANLGVELSKVRQAVEFIIGRGDRIILGNIGLTPRSKKVIELAVDEAHRLNHNYVGTDHILLGLVREGEGIAAGVLASLGVSLMRVRNEILRVLANDTGDMVEETQSANDVPPPQWKSRNSFDDYQFTTQVEHVLKYAQEEALNLQHNYAGTEHLLLGLLREDDAAAARILKSLGAELIRTRAEVERLVGHGTRTATGEVSLTPLARAQIHLAADEASRLGNYAIGTEHLLLGLAREGEGIASSVLGSLGVSLEMVRAKTIEFIQG